ncbi:MAG: molybdenum cofactor guanylyltransferase [Terrimicrobiaceae bacterium]
MRKFAAVLLAGGRSTRMGTNKASLDYDGQPLWCFQMEKLLRLNPGQLFFSVRPGMGFPRGSWTFVHDRSGNLGPLGGLEAALRLTGQEFLITLAVDMPAMTSVFLSSLLEEAGPYGVVPHLDGFYCGTAAVFPKSILPLVEEILACDDRSFQHLIDAALRARLMTVREITAAEAPLFENCNLPGDLKRVPVVS